MSVAQLKQHLNIIKMLVTDMLVSFDKEKKNANLCKRITRRET